MRLFFVVSFVLLTINSQILKLEMEKKEKSNEQISYNLFKLLFSSKVMPVFKNKISELYTINFKIGSNKDKFNVIIDTGSTILWLPSYSCYKCTSNIKKFNEYLSNTYVNLSDPLVINYADGSFSKGYLSKELIELDSISTNLTFLLSYEINNEIEGVSGIMGLGLDYKGQESASIIKMLYENKQINKQMFSQKFEGDKGLLYFGDYAEEIAGDKGNLTNCTIKNNWYYYMWVCKIDAFFSGFDYSYNKVLPITNTYVLFDSGTNFLIVSDDFEKQLINYVFRDYIKNETCFKKGSYYFCYTFFHDLHFPPVYLIINKIAYRIDGRDLFFESNGQIQFKVIFNSEAKNLWILGQPFLQLFHVIYDMDNELVSFYGGNKFNAFNHTDDGNAPIDDILPKPIFILVGFLIVIILGLIIWKFNSRSRPRIDDLSNQRGIINEPMLN